MKRSVKVLGMTFGATALLSLGVACSSRQTPAPSVGAPTPPMEPSTVPPAPPGATSEMDQPGAMPSGQPGAASDWQTPGRQAGPPEQPPGALGSGLQGEQPHAGATTDKALCESLATVAKLRVEDAQNGVSIVATPKPGTSLAAVRDDARKLEGTIHAGAEAHAAQAGGEGCGIAQLGRLPSVTTVITEAPNAMRILMTTSNPGEVKDLRRMTRDEIGSLNRGAGSRQ